MRLRRTRPSRGLAGSRELLWQLEYERRPNGREREPQERVAARARDRRLGGSRTHALPTSFRRGTHAGYYARRVISRAVPWPGADRREKAPPMAAARWRRFLRPWPAGSVWPLKPAAA